ncbi:MAG: hypothetical protein ACO28O_05245 [Crocinitomicaceae bacterium]
MNYGLCRNSENCSSSDNWMRFFYFIVFVFGFTAVNSQEIIELDSLNPLAHARAIRCLGDKIYLGDNLGRCLSYSVTSQELKLLRQQQPEIRDVEASPKGVFWMQTADEGIVFTNESITPSLFPKAGGKSVFLDGIAIQDSVVFVMGDPIDGEFQLFLSKNLGRTWEAIHGVLAKTGEAGYAASGTTVHLLEKRLYFVSGGTESRIFIGKRWGKRWKSYSIPFENGEGEGAYSLCIIDRKNLVAVGGNYQFPSRRTKVCFTSSDGGKSWKEATTPPMGYRSCVIHYEGVTYACGTNGLDFSTDNGMHWTPWIRGSFLAMDVAKGVPDKLWVTTKNNLGLYAFEPVSIAWIINKP